MDLKLKRGFLYFAACLTTWIAIDVMNPPDFTLKWFICASVIVISLMVVRYSGSDA